MEKNQRLEEIKKDNYRIFDLMSRYLNYAPDLISRNEIEEITINGVSNEYAFSVILAAAFGLDIIDNEEDKNFFNQYFPRMIRQLDASEYYNNPYYKNIKIPSIKVGNSEFKYEKFKPLEGFVWNDILQTKEGRHIPQIGFFETEFRYPAILEKDRIWMTITPNEIETMKEPIERAFGNILTFGLGLGYYAYMVSEKDEVESVTVVEINKDIIDLFNKYILPQFENAHKIKIVQADAFEFAEKQMTIGVYDFVFTDLWHDVSDGIDLYLKMKKFEKNNPQTEFSYWIEKSILCYL